MSALGRGVGLGVVGAGDGVFGPYAPLTTSLQLDGVLESVQFPDAAALNILGAETKTVGVWFRAALGMSAGVAKGIFGKYFNNAPGADTGWRLFASNDIIWFQLRDALVSEPVLLDNIVGFDGDWHPLVGTYGGGGDANSMKIYVDGVQPPQTAFPGGVLGDTSTVAPLCTGYIFNRPTSYAEINVCHQFMIDRELSPSQVAALSAGGYPTNLIDVYGADVLHWCTDGDGCATGPWGMNELGTVGINGIASQCEPTDFILNVPPSP